MVILNKAMVDELFQREAVLIGTTDCVPKHRAAALFGKEAVNACCKDSAAPGRFWNCYCTNGLDLSYLTHRGFQAAASFYNVQQLQKESEDYEKEARA